MKIIIHGYGKMGKMIHNLLPINFELIGIIDKEYIGEYKLSYEQLLSIDYDVLIDFSHHLLIDNLLDYLEKRPKKSIIATTKLSSSQISRIKELSEKVAIYQDYNTSYGVYAMIKTVTYMKELLAEYDIEIVEKHHKYKVDAPSGTAKRLLSTLNNQRNYQEVLNYNEVDKKAEDMIGVHAIRSGNIVGEHEVIFGSDNDIISIKHEALSKELFAKGALKICEILRGKSRGLYKLEEIFEERI